MDDQSEAVVGADVAGEEPITLVAEDIPPNPSPEFLRQRRERLEIERKAMEASDGDAVPASPEQIEALNNTLLVNEGRPATIGDIEAVKAVLRDEMLKKATSEVTRDDDRNFTSAKIVRFRGGPADEMIVSSASSATPKARRSRQFTASPFVRSNALKKKRRPTLRRPTNGWRSTSASVDTCRRCRSMESVRGSEPDFLACPSRRFPLPRRALFSILECPQFAATTASSPSTARQRPSPNG